jgi:hypothetical protein
MDIEFHWSSRAVLEDPAVVETEIRETLQNSELQPCHPGQVLVFLAVGGPLNTTLTGSVKCHCGTTLATFRGDSQASNVVITKSEQINSR